jgi:hypothetical protein
MADESNNGEKPSLIVSLAEVKEKHRKISREELDNDLTALSFAMLQRQQHAEARLAQLEQVMRGHAQAIAILDVRSVAGRIRRAKVWLRASRELVASYLRRAPKA